MERIANFRDISEDLHKSFIKPQRIYRSAMLDSATESDIMRLISEYNLKSIIDLRSHFECRRMNVHQKFEEENGNYYKVDLANYLRTVCIYKLIFRNYTNLFHTFLALFT